MVRVYRVVSTEMEEVQRTGVGGGRGHPGPIGEVSPCLPLEQGPNKSLS